MIGKLLVFSDHDVVGYNAKRVVEVWLDDYKRLYYNIKPSQKVIMVHFR